MLQFMRARADAEDGLLEKFTANADYGGEEMVTAQANALREWVRCNCTGIAWVELIKQVEYRPMESEGYVPDEEDWELSVLFNDPQDAERFASEFEVVDKFSAT
jgi:hypothetical protein